MRTRLVLDANIYASALMSPKGLPAKVLLIAMEDSTYELVLSQPILDELQRILFYPKVRSRIPKLDTEISHFLNALSIISHFCIQRHFYEVLVEQDPDDDIYLIAALESHAQYVITGDNHLLKLKQIEDVKIVTAAQFLSTF